jgi:uncharacterized protein YbcI
MSRIQKKGQLESEISASITQFEREHLGRGPKEVRTWIIQDMILIRLRGVLTPAEEKLAADPDGHHLVKDVRTRLIEGARSILDEMIERLTGIQVLSLHSDISLRRGERVIVFTLAEDLEGKLRR